MKRICVFTGSHLGQNPLYKEATEELGKALCNENLGLVYGGGKVGLMGVIAETMLNNGAEVIGVIPKYLEEKEIARTDLKDLRIVHTMHERKQLMNELSDAFVTLPGGLGTLDETFEILTWAQIHLHRKPLAFLNTNGYFDSLLKFIETAISEGFIKQVFWDHVIVEDSAESLVKKLNDLKQINYDENIFEQIKKEHNES